MGVWGTGIFSDDTASDVREDYREYVGDGQSGAAATDKILREYGSAEAEQTGVVWLALAAVQWKCGRLEERVKTEALRVIESGDDLKRWPDKKLAAKRAAALVKLKEELLSPQPAEKRIAKVFRCTCEWEIGELLGYRLKSGKWIALRVTDMKTDKGGTYPQCEILEWSGESAPNASELAGLPIRTVGANGRAGHGQVTIGCASKREFPAERIVRLNAKSAPSDSSDIRIPLRGGGVSFKGGGLPFVLWRQFDTYLEREYGLH